MLSIFSNMIERFLEIFMDDFSVFGDSFDDCLTNLKKNGFLTLTILKEKRKLFLHLLKETKNWFIKDILFLKEIINKFSK